MNSRNEEVIETIRLSDRDKTKLIWAVGAASGQPAESSKRRLRVDSAHNEGVLTLLGDNGERTRFSVLTRDLSRWGASVLHGRYLYPETRCELEILSIDNTWHTCAGEIRHIRHLQGMIHNLGIHFDKPIDLNDFATLSPDEETRHLQELADDMISTGTVNVIKQMVRRVLVVDDFASDRKLFSYWLTKVGLEVSTANDPTSARERVDEEEFDMLVIDGMLGHETGQELIKNLRTTGYVGPILAVSADEGGEMERLAMNAGANAFLAKPFTEQQITESALHLMGMNSSSNSEPIYSSCNDDEEMRPLLTAFTNKLGQQMQDLHAANAKNDYDTIDEISRSLKGAGTSYGFEVITEHAQQVTVCLEDSEADMTKIRQAVNELIGILERIKLQ